jgi:hypothetical protein
MPRLNEISMDVRTLGFTLALSVSSGLFLGLVPALKYGGPRISAALQSTGRAASVSRERHRARNVLVVAQVAIALVLLVSAGLMIRTAQALRTVEPGSRMRSISRPCASRFRLRSLRSPNWSSESKTTWPTNWRRFAG